MTQNSTFSDPSTTIQELRQEIKKFRDQRGWQGEDPKDIALSLVLEAAELLEHFQWKTGQEVANEARLYGPICDELADVFWWILVMADRLDIDVSRALQLKISKNNSKYPAKLFKKDMTQEQRNREYYKIKAKYRGGHPLA